MEQLKSIDREIGITALIKTLAETYEEAATIEMKKTRDKVLHKRDFLLRVLETYIEVRNNYQDQIKSINRKKNFLNFAKKDKKNKGPYLTISKTKGTAAVLLTSNRSMVGAVNLKVFFNFLKFINNNQNVDIFVVGRVGRNFLNTSRPDLKYEYFDFPEKTEIKELAELTKKIIDYSKIEVFHGKYLNLVNQVGVQTPVTGEVETQPGETTQATKKEAYLFEPSLEEVLHFFETQIFSSLFSQTLSETNLANLGSRIQSMEQTIVGTEEHLKKLKLMQIRAKKDLLAKKQQQRIVASMIARK
jgi:ATP synthase F1 gamma subunit